MQWTFCKKRNESIHSQITLDITSILLCNITMREKGSTEDKVNRKLKKEVLSYL